MNLPAVAFAALLVNAAMCAAYATTPDTFLTTTAMLTAVLILTLRGEKHGEQHDSQRHARGDHHEG